MCAFDFATTQPPRPRKNTLRKFIENVQGAFITKKIFLACEPYLGRMKSYGAFFLRNFILRSKTYILNPGNDARLGDFRFFFLKSYTFSWPTKSSWRESRISTASSCTELFFLRNRILQTMNYIIHHLDDARIVGLHVELCVWIRRSGLRLGPGGLWLTTLFF